MGIQGIKYSLDSFYNLSGAISIQVVFLSIVVLLRWQASKGTKASQREYRNFTSAIFQNKTTLWSISTFEIVVLIVLFSLSGFSKKLSLGKYHILPFVFFVIWLLYLIFTKKTSGDEEEPKSSYANIFHKCNNKNFLLIFALIFVLFIVLAFLNFNLVSRFEKVFSVPKNIGLGVILSMITSFPEFASFTFLFISKCYKTACSGFLGSALFNLMLPVFTQLIKGSWLFEEIDSDASERYSLIFWLGSVLAINSLFFLGFFRNSYTSLNWTIKKDKLGVLCCSAVILIYLGCSFIFPIVVQGANT